MRKLLFTFISVLAASALNAQTKTFVKGPKLKDPHNLVQDISESKDEYTVITTTNRIAHVLDIIPHNYENLHVSTLSKETLKPTEKSYEVFDYAKIKGTYDYCYTSHLWIWDDKYVSAWGIFPAIDGYHNNKFVIEIAQRKRKSEKLDIITIPVRDYMDNDLDTFQSFQILQDMANDRLIVAILKKRDDKQYRTEILFVDLESLSVSRVTEIINTQNGWGKEFNLKVNIGDNKILFAVDNLTDKTFITDEEENDANSEDSVYYYVFNLKKKKLETLVYASLKKDRKEMRTTYSSGHYVILNGFRSGAKDFEVCIYNTMTDAATLLKPKFPAVDGLDEGWRDKRKYKWVKGFWAMDGMRYDLEKKNIFFVLSRMDYYNPVNTIAKDDDYFDNENGVINESNHVGVIIGSDGKVELGSEMQTSALYSSRDFLFLGKTFYINGEPHFIYHEAVANYEEGVWNGGRFITDFFRLPGDKKRLKKFNIVYRKIPGKGEEEKPVTVVANKDTKCMAMLARTLRTDDGLIVLSRSDKSFYFLKLLLK